MQFRHKEMITLHFDLLIDDKFSQKNRCICLEMDLSVAFLRMEKPQPAVNLTVIMECVSVDHLQQLDFYLRRNLFIIQLH